MMLRSFIAVEIPAEIQSTIALAVAPLQKALPRPLMRWVTSGNVHLTLKFLGDVSPANLERLAEALEVEVITHEPFNMSVDGLGTYPNPRRVRVVWIGLDAPVALKVLLHGVEAVAERLGFPSEDRPFSPHLTIGRVGQSTTRMDIQRISAAFETTKVGPLGSVRVDAVHILKSDLQPGGSVYTNVYTLKMKST
jgi:RNA 2',3'-cyclic 3'-phosphodiesterase